LKNKEKESRIMKKRTTICTCTCLCVNAMLAFRLCLIHINILLCTKRFCTKRSCYEWSSIRPREFVVSNRTELYPLYFRSAIRHSNNYVNKDGRLKEMWSGTNLKMTLNPLSNPKGTNLTCELCQKPAFIQCTKCRVTYYW
jgi:hypothetical protein